MERFNQRVASCLAELAREGRARQPTIVALWDGRAEAERAPGDVRLDACGGSKVRAVLCVLRAVLRERPDVVLFGHVLLVPLAAAVGLLRPGARRILFAHGIEVWEPPSRLRGLIVERCVDAVVSVSRFTAERMQQAYGLGPGRFRLLANAVDPPSRDLTHLPFPTEGRFRLLTVTRLDRRDAYKNVDKVVQALPSVLAEFPDTHYYVVGEGDARAGLEALASRLGVTRHVHFTGRLEDPHRDALSKDCHLFVLPSTGEGFGIAFLEAWRHGLPVICGDRDAATEVVQDSVSGLCVAPEPEAIGAAVKRLLGDPDRMRAMGEAGRTRALREYSHARFLASLGGILNGGGACAG